MAVAAAKKECFSGRAAKRHADACSQHKIFQTQKTIMIHWVGERAKTSCGGASCCRSLHVVEIGAYKLPKPTKSLPHEFFPDSRHCALCSLNVFCEGQKQTGAQGRKNQKRVGAAL